HLRSSNVTATGGGVVWGIDIALVIQFCSYWSQPSTFPGRHRLLPVSTSIGTMRLLPGNDLNLGILPGRNACLQFPRTSRDKHLYICGGTGTGKSKFL